ncbi:hydroxymethylglutaryl-CoA synthase [Lacticigenium naphthae]|uniref:hydroxymethylglutaryl-CoA synthase n=1 Tax=Lacticigenium naphthae TaxID=515351 RepID=UPI000414583A|nr:hydroxymethylglutaryl-CoA synthase [Lacticigenium naphthae]
MDIGIDKIGFYTPHIHVDMKKLAEARKIDPAKYTIGIGQDKMAIAPLTQDAVTMAANAALKILDEEDRNAVDMVLLGTESGVDHSKSGAVWVHHLTDIQSQARAFELKQACYGATAGIQMAMGHITMNPDRKVLVVGSDIAKYGLNTGGEPTQGAGAVALLISANPRILAIDPTSAMYTSDIMDFWRPLYSDKAKVDGKFSNQAYIEFFLRVWKDYQEKTNRSLDDFEALCFHLPYTKMGRKALGAVLESATAENKERLERHYEESIVYNRIVGNVYTGALYLNLLSLLEQGEELPAGSRIGLFSYGSGAVGEFFSGTLQPNYKKQLLTTEHGKMLNDRRELSIEEYEASFEDALPIDGSTRELDGQTDPGPVYLAGIADDIRQYMKK